MYYPDMALYQSFVVENDPPTLSIGWLDGAHEYAQGQVSELFLERLWAFCQLPVNQTRGLYECDLCTEPGFGVRLQRGDEQIWLGSAEVRVFAPDDTAYAAPDMIYHYVVDHHYLPPEEFIRAVLDGPLPDSPEYLARAEQYEWGRLARRLRR
jgi:hypothetical protein